MDEHFQAIFFNRDMRPKTLSEMERCVVIIPERRDLVMVRHLIRNWMQLAKNPALFLPRFATLFEIGLELSGLSPKNLVMQDDFSLILEKNSDHLIPVKFSGPEFKSYKKHLFNFMNLASLLEGDFPELAKHSKGKECVRELSESGLSPAGYQAIKKWIQDKGYFFRGEIFIKALEKIPDKAAGAMEKNFFILGAGKFSKLEKKFLQRLRARDLNPAPANVSSAEPARSIAAAMFDPLYQRDSSGGAVSLPLHFYKAKSLYQQFLLAKHAVHGILVQDSSACLSDIALIAGNQDSLDQLAIYFASQELPFFCHSFETQESHTHMILQVILDALDNDLRAMVAMYNRYFLSLTPENQNTGADKVNQYIDLTSALQSERMELAFLIGQIRKFLTEANGPRAEDPILQFSVSRIQLEHFLEYLTLAQKMQQAGRKSFAPKSMVNFLNSTMQGFQDLLQKKDLPKNNFNVFESLLVKVFESEIRLKEACQYFQAILPAASASRMGQLSEGVHLLNLDSALFKKYRHLLILDTDENIFLKNRQRNQLFSEQNHDLFQDIIFGQREGQIYVHRFQQLLHRDLVTLHFFLPDYNEESIVSQYIENLLRIYPPKNYHIFIGSENKSIKQAPFSLRSRDLTFPQKNPAAQYPKLVLEEELAMEPGKRSPGHDLAALWPGNPAPGMEHIFLALRSVSKIESFMKCPAQFVLNLQRKEQSIASLERFRPGNFFHKTLGHFLLYYKGRDLLKNQVEFETYSAIANKKLDDFLLFFLSNQPEQDALVPDSFRFVNNILKESGALSIYEKFAAEEIKSDPNQARTLANTRIEIVKFLIRFIQELGITDRKVTETFHVETFFGNFRIPLPGSPALTIHAGYIDFLYLNANNELRLFDFKSSKLDTYAEEIKQFNLVQLFLYREALKRALASGDFSFFAKPAHQNASSPANSANRIVNYLDKNFMERLHRDPPQGIHADYASHRKKFFMVPIPETLAFTPEEDSYNFISELLARIGDGKKFLPKKSSQCPYCAYYNFCPESELSSIDTGNFSARGLRFSERSIDAGKFQLNMKPANGPESSQAQDKKVLIRFNPESSRSIRALDKNIIISAGAGAGKTELLSARYLYLLLHDDKITVENIACITFTNKAVGEMKKRILEKIHTSLESRIKPVILDDTRDYALSERQYQKLLAAKESFFEKSRILTFHSFCQENIAEYARFSHDFDHYDLESEIAPLYLVEDEKIIYLKSLARRGFAEIFQKENFSKREVNFFLDWFRNENLYYEFDAASGGLIRDILTLLDKINLSGRGFAEWQYSYRDFLENYRLLLEKEKNSYLTLCRQLEDFVNRNAAPAKKPQLILKIRQHQFANLSASFREPELKEEVKNLLEQKEENLFYTQVVKGLEHLAPENIPFTDLAKHLQLGREYAINKALFHIAQGVQEHLEEFKRENGYLEQSDLHLRFLKLMQDKTMGEKIQKLLRQKFRYIMVDEFQDTNWLQERILGKLHEEEKNFLFLVGDMKQSIYRFQQCDDQIFQKYIQRCQTRSNYHYLSLRENYRSRKQIVQFNNHFFSKNKLASYNVFPLTSREIKPELAEPARQSPEKARIIFNQVIYDKRRIDEEYSREANKAFTESELNVLAKIKEAELIAHAILENDPAQERLASFGILIRSYTRINFLLETLKKFNIAYSFVMKRGLLDQPEVNIFISLLKVIYRTSSPLDLPIFAEGKIRGLQSSLLTGEFAERGFILTAYTVFHSPLFQDYLKSLVNYHEALDVIRILLAELSKIARQWGDHPFHALHRAERMGMEMGMESFRDNAVRIMTIHSAKGLEFDQLFLVNLSGRENADRAAYSFINQVMDQEQNWIDFSIRRGKDLLGRQLFQSMMAGDYQRRNQAFEERETANLLYVALTRARDNIFVSMLKNNINAKSSLSVNMLRNLDFNLFREQNWDLPSSAREVTLPGVEDKIHLHRIDISEINFFSEKPIPENKTSIMLEKEVAGFFYQRMRPEIRAVSQIVSEAQKDAAAEKNLPQPDFQDTEVSETMEAQWRETGKISEKVNPREVGNFVHAFLEKNLKQMVSGKFDFDGAFQIFQDEHPYRSRAFYLLAGKMARRVMQAKEFFDLMQDGANLYFESPILFQTSADGRFAFGVMDLLIEKKNELIILDYKTHEKAGENSAELREKYRKQLELYEQGLSRICPEKSIRKFLLHITEKKAELENI